MINLNLTRPEFDLVADCLLHRKNTLQSILSGSRATDEYRKENDLCTQVLTQMVKKLKEAG